MAKMSNEEILRVIESIDFDDHFRVLYQKELTPKVKGLKMCPDLSAWKLQQIRNASLGVGNISIMNAQAAKDEKAQQDAYYTEHPDETPADWKFTQHREQPADYTPTWITSTDGNLTGKVVTNAKNGKMYLMMSLDCAEGYDQETSINVTMNGVQFTLFNTAPIEWGFRAESKTSQDSVLGYWPLDLDRIIDIRKN